MSTVFKFILYLGVIASLAGFALPYFSDHPTFADALANAPQYTRNALSFGGLGLIAIGLIGRSATRKEEVEWQ